MLKNANPNQKLLGQIQVKLVGVWGMLRFATKVRFGSKQPSKEARIDPTRAQSNWSPTQLLMEFTKSDPIINWVEMSKQILN